MINNKFSEMVGRRLLKISEISENTGISRGALTNLYYKRTKAISLNTLDKLCNYLNCSITDIIEYQD